MTRTISSNLNTHKQGRVTTLTRCVKIKRTDGVFVNYTLFDSNITIDIGDGDGSQTYTTVFSPMTSAIVSAAGLQADNLSITGPLVEDSIDAADLRAGKFDYAEVTIFEVNWADLTQGAMIVFFGWWGPVEIKDVEFTVQFRPLTDAYAQHFGDIVQPSCRANLGDTKCKIPVWLDPVERSTAYTAGTVLGNPGSCVRGYYDPGVGPLEPLTVTNPGAESGVTGWTNEASTLTTRSASPSPRSGTAYFNWGAAASGRARQDVAIPGSYNTGIDAGNYQVVLTWWQNSFATGNDQGRMILECYDGSMVQQGATQTASYTNPTVWTKRDITFAVPATTRTIRIKIEGDRLSGTNLDAYFDDIELFLQDISTSVPEIVDNVYFECTTSGTTSGSPVSYDPTLGNTSTDGTAVFTAKNAWTRAGSINTVTSRRAFTVTIDEPRAVDGWFNGGVIRWITGDNTGTYQEVKTWVQSSSAITMYLSLPYMPQPDDEFEISPGCDLKISTCLSKFDNVVNFRGEPHVPGADVALDYPDSQ